MLQQRDPEGQDNDLHERIRQAELVAAIGIALTSSAPLAAQLQRCVAAIVAHLDIAFARIWTVDESRQILELRASAGLYTHLDGAHSRIPLGMFKIGRIARDRRPHLTNVVLGDPEVHDQEWARRERMVAFAGYPLIVGERVVGVLGLFAQRALAASTLTTLASVSHGVAVGIARAEADAERERLLASEQHARAELELIHQFGQNLAAELELGALVQSVTDTVTAISGAQFGAFFYNILDQRGETYTLYALSGVPREAFANFPMPRGTAIFGPTFQGEGIIRLDDVTTDPRYGQNAPYTGMPPGHLPVRSYLAVPVVSRAGEVIGGLFFGHPEPGIFSDRVERIVAGVAGQAAIAMDNARLYRQAQEALQLRDHFLATVAHDLNTPLTVIRGQAQLLRRLATRVEGGVHPSLANGVERIEQTTAKMSMMINELADLSQLAAGKIPALERQRADLSALVRRVVAEYQGASPSHQVILETALSGLTGEWDTPRLERVLDNLVGNAVKYSPAGGTVTVTITHEEETGGAWATVVVQDCGLGIPAADLPHIFEPFYRATNVVGQIRGTGLGLAAAQQVIEQHDGTLTVTSQEGAGSTFTIRLPLLAEAEKAEAAAGEGRSTYSADRP